MSGQRNTALTALTACWRKLSEKMRTEKAKKAVSAASVLLLAAAVLLCVTVMIQVRTVGYVSIGGRSLFRVVTGSMEPTISTGALLMTEQVKIDDIQVGDIVCYRSENPTMDGLVITHRVTAVLHGETTYLETKGDANAVVDSQYVSDRNLIGRVCWFSKEGSVMARVISALSSGTGFMALILFPSLLIAGMLMSRSVRSIRREIEDLTRLEREAEAGTQSEEQKQLAAWGITPEEYAEMRERIVRELMAERETILEMLRIQLAQELQQGEDHEHQEIHAETGFRESRSLSEGAKETT